MLPRRRRARRPPDLDRGGEVVTWSGFEGMSHTRRVSRRARAEHFEIVIATTSVVPHGRGVLHGDAP
jgi:hypothetical protein